MNFQYVAGAFGARCVPAVPLIAIAGLLSGCASFRGSQERVTAQDFAVFQPVCPTQGEMTAPHATESNGAYRNRIVLLCIQVINSKYAAFTDELSKEASGTNLGTDILAQVLATGASVVNGATAAKRLAAGSAGAFLRCRGRRD